MWYHGTCGWSGNESDIVLDRWNGIVCSASCPKCSGDWPFIFDDWEPEDETEDLDWTPTNRANKLAAKYTRIKTEWD